MSDYFVSGVNRNQIQNLNSDQIKYFLDMNGALMKELGYKLPK